MECDRCRLAARVDDDAELTDAAAHDANMADEESGGKRPRGTGTA